MKNTMKIINKVLNEWLEENSFDARIRGMEYDFGWYASDNTIVYSLLFMPEEEIRWEELLVECGLRYEVPSFVSAFLHELGHSITWDQLDEEQKDEDEEMKTLLEEEPASFAEDIYQVYYHLPSEIIATLWMVDYINQNTDKVIDLTNRVQKAIEHYYKEMSKENA
jgi:hypothetical protein